MEANKKKSVPFVKVSLLSKSNAKRSHLNFRTIFYIVTICNASSEHELPEEKNHNNKSDLLKERKASVLACNAFISFTNCLRDVCCALPIEMAGVFLLACLLFLFFYQDQFSVKREN